MTPELRQLRYFVAVAERGSFTGAAEDLFVAQQAVSQQVKALDTALGVTLLWRTSRQVELTPAGKVFLADCRRGAGRGRPGRAAGPGGGPAMSRWSCGRGIWLLATHDAVVSACRAAGFEPRPDQEAAGSTVWGYIAQGQGIGLVVSSLAEQLPLGVRLIDIAPPAPPPLGINRGLAAGRAAGGRGAAARGRRRAGRGTRLGLAPSVRNSSVDTNVRLT